MRDKSTLPEEEKPSLGREEEGPQREEKRRNQLWGPQREERRRNQLWEPQREETTERRVEVETFTTEKKRIIKLSGVDVNYPSEQGWTALATAVNRVKLQTVKILFSRGAIWDTQCDVLLEIIKGNTILNLTRFITYCDARKTRGNVLLLLEVKMLPKDLIREIAKFF